MKRRAPLGLVLLALLWALSLGSPGWGGTLGDVVYPATEALAPAYFPHWVHRIKYKCYACHDDLFPMKRGPSLTMAAMSRGESCGACHNGKVAFGVDTCQRCHIQQP